MFKKLLLLVSLGLIASCLSMSPAAAQASRTWVSGVGDDANPCTRTAPCKTFAGAISKTAPSGEIDCLDPGGFGALTITKAVTIDCSGTFGSVLVSGTNAINVSAAAGDKVILRGLSINGFGTGINGIQFNSGGQLSVERCFIARFTGTGINVVVSNSAQLYVTNTVISNNNSGISMQTTGQLLAVIDHTNVFNVTTNGITTGGAQGIAVNISNSHVATAQTGINAGGAGTAISIDTSTVEGTGTAMNAAVSGSVIRASNNLIYGNTTNFSFVAGGTIASTGNNRVTPSGAQTPNLTITQQ
jgi:hypothetical protein